MVDPDILRSKTVQILHHTDRLLSRQALTAQNLRDDEDCANIVLMDLQQAIQGCIDLAIHVCVDENLGAPSTAAQAFDLLSRDKRLDAALAVRLTRAAGLRNLIVHQYTDVDYALIVEVMKNSLNDLRDLAAAIRSTE